ncbi:50S ribosomal protein L24e [Halomarina oriensis]|uniref:Large ribosomal subunit protein eL24 n=1 Tax=Halomarina oriensis TaxID=671145 RepID=A0A6B0GNC3_9EURY|nr:50S ribosomal protein L24e [Halomarina oriensis]MWG33078.1 50S ribosomal protein L24e [Halomarina oriensis]
MPANRTCDYTGEEIEPGTGVMYVKNDGSVLHFVNSKAEKNYLMGREARDLEWTEAGRRARAANRGQQAQQVADEGSTEMDEPESDEAEGLDEEPDDTEGVDETKPEGTTGEQRPGDEDAIEGSDVEDLDEDEESDSAPDLESAEAEAADENSDDEEDDEE